MKSGLPTRSAVAATFTAALEMAREGMVMIRQTGIYGPIYVRGTPNGREDRKATTATEQTTDE